MCTVMLWLEIGVIISLDTMNHGCVTLVECCRKIIPCVILQVTTVLPVTSKPFYGCFAQTYKSTVFQNPT